MEETQTTPVEEIHPVFKTPEFDSAFRFYNDNLRLVKTLSKNLSLRELQRVFDIIVSYPFDDHATRKMKQGGKESDIARRAVALMTAKRSLENANDLAITEKRMKEQEANKGETNGSTETSKTE